MTYLILLKDYIILIWGTVSSLPNIEPNKENLLSYQPIKLITAYKSIFFFHFLRTKSAKLVHTLDTSIKIMKKMSLLYHNVANEPIFNFVLMSYSPLFTFSLGENEHLSIISI